MEKETVICMPRAGETEAEFLARCFGAVGELPEDMKGEVPDEEIILDGEVDS